MGFTSGGAEIDSKYAAAGEPWRWGVPVPSTHCCAPPNGRRLAASCVRNVRNVRWKKGNYELTSKKFCFCVTFWQKTEIAQKLS